jgi:hypothetical protein
MAKQTRTQAEKDRKLRRTALWDIFAFTMVLTSCIHTIDVLHFPDLKIPLGPPNPDVWVRLSEVRQWLTGGGFYNHDIPHTNAPFGGISTPWTRPVDMLLAFLYYCFTPHSISPTLRLLFASAWMAPMLCLIAVATMARTVRRHFELSTHARIATVLLMIFNPYLGDYFSPGDADHHGFMSTLWCGVLCLITIENMSLAAAFGAGALLGGITWVSPEGLMLAAPVYALLGIEALFRPQKMISVAQVTLGAAVAVSIGLVIERSPQELLHPYYDTLSIVQVLLLWLCAAAAGVLALLYDKGIAMKARIDAVAAGALAIGGTMYAIYPKFFGGPMVEVDPFIFTNFLPNVTEAQPLFKSPWPDVINGLTEPVLAAALLVMCFWRSWRQMRPEKRRYFGLLAVLLVYTMALTLFQIRWQYYVQPIAIILCAALLPGVAMATTFGLKRPPPRQWRQYLWMVVIFGAMNAADRVVPVINRGPQVLCMNEIRYVLQTQQLPKLIGDNDQIVYMPENAGGDALFFSPYRIIASNYHREGQGLQDAHNLSTSKTEAEAYAVLHKRQVQAMLYCPVNYAKNAWLRTVAEGGKYPPWMTPVGGLKFFPFETEVPKPVLFKINTSPDAPQDAASHKKPAKTR